MLRVSLYLEGVLLAPGPYANSITVSARLGLSSEERAPNIDLESISGSSRIPAYPTAGDEKERSQRHQHHQRHHAPGGISTFWVPIPKLTDSHSWPSREVGSIGHGAESKPQSLRLSVCGDDIPSGKRRASMHSADDLTITNLQPIGSCVIEGKELAPNEQGENPTVCVKLWTIALVDGVWKQRSNGCAIISWLNSIITEPPRWNFAEVGRVAYSTMKDGRDRPPLAIALAMARSDTDQRRIMCRAELEDDKICEYVRLTIGSSDMMRLYRNGDDWNIDSLKVSRRSVVWFELMAMAFASRRPSYANNKQSISASWKDSINWVLLEKHIREGKKNMVGSILLEVAGDICTLFPTTMPYAPDRESHKSTTKFEETEHTTHDDGYLPSENSALPMQAKQMVQSTGKITDTHHCPISTRALDCETGAILAKLMADALPEHGADAHKTAEILTSRGKDEDGILVAACHILSFIAGSLKGYEAAIGAFTAYSPSAAEPDRRGKSSIQPTEGTAAKQAALQTYAGHAAMIFLGVEGLEKAQFAADAAEASATTSGKCARPPAAVPAVLPFLAGICETTTWCGPHLTPLAPPGSIPIPKLSTLQTYRDLGLEGIFPEGSTSRTVTESGQFYADLVAICLSDGRSYSVATARSKEKEGQKPTLGYRLSTASVGGGYEGMLLISHEANNDYIDGLRRNPAPGVTTVADYIPPCTQDPGSLKVERYTRSRDNMAAITAAHDEFCKLWKKNIGTGISGKFAQKPRCEVVTRVRALEPDDRYQWWVYDLCELLPVIADNISSGRIYSVNAFFGDIMGVRFLTLSVSVVAAA
jgi:hypothetical protein